MLDSMRVQIVTGVPCFVIRLFHFEVISIGGLKNTGARYCFQCRHNTFERTLICSKHRALFGNIGRKKGKYANGI